MAGYDLDVPDDRAALAALVKALHYFLFEQFEALDERVSQTRPSADEAEQWTNLRAAWQSLPQRSQLVDAVGDASEENLDRHGLTGPQLRAKIDTWRILDAEAQDGVLVTVGGEAITVRSDDSRELRWDFANTLLDSLKDISGIFGPIKEFKEMLHAHWGRFRIIDKLKRRARSAFSRLEDELDD